MSEWKKVRLGELCDFINGGAWSDKEYAPEGIPVLKVTNCKNSGFSLSELSYLPHSLEQKYIQNKLQRNDVIIATVGSHPNLVNSSAGRSVIVNSFVEGFYLNQNAVCIRTKDEEILDQLFWGYYSKYYLFQNYIQMRGKGAANQMRIAISAIKNYPMPLPPINVQRHIASILSRYDSLIENYQKQIKLLEEAARRLYKEWFIDLRFPGHENTNIVDGVPEGWERKKVGEIGTVITGKTPSTSNKENYGGSIPFITIPDMHTGIYPVSSVFLSEKGAESQSKKYIPQGALIVSCIGTAGLVCITKERCQTNQQINSLILDDKEMLHYMYFVFLSLKEHLNNIGSNGATMTNVNKSKFEGIDIVVPSSCIIRDFSQRTTPYFENILSLQSQLRLLTEARDRLLPKLMSGEITV
ncbi:MAG: restriction endonuclease subunit S [Candidatus Onthomorpha sp.]|nr:restriction endonuclease subunit S [Candidatus Onthomorpha sp.]